MKEAEEDRLSLPRGVWMLGLVSLFMDTSSEMIHALLPVYLTTVLGAGMMTLGVIEGVAEAVAALTKLFAGALSDWLGKRKLLTALGYGLAGLSKPVFPLAPSIGWIVGARIVDRLGKGIRGAPRDALLADLTPPEQYQAAYGLRQSLDTAGAFLGPLIALALMLAWRVEIRTVFWIAVFPAMIATALVVFAVTDTPPAHMVKRVNWPIQRQDLARLSRPFWTVLLIAVLMTLARFSEAFLILRVQSFGLALALVPLVLVLMNVAYALSAYPAGLLAERAQPPHVLLLGMTALMAADILLAASTGLWMASGGVLLWGLHMGLTQGILSAMIAGTTPPDLRGTGFGLFNLATGLAVLLASPIAGALWSAWGPSGAFIGGTVLAGLTCAVLGLVIRALPEFDQTAGSQRPTRTP